MEVDESEHLFLEFSLWNLNSESRLKAFEGYLFGTSKNAGVRGGACNTKVSMLRGHPLNVCESHHKSRLGVTHCQQEDINMPWTV